MTTVLITGAAGVLGKAVVALLEQEEGFSLRLTDIVPVATSHEFVKADLTRWEDVRGLCDGADEVLHMAAVHPWRQYTPEQYTECNILGTHNVLQAAVKARVRRVVYTSSVAAMGYRLDPAHPLPFDESRPCEPVEDIYGITKRVGEQFCEMFRLRNGLRYIVLRPGTFIPRDEDDPVFGLGLLSSWVHRSDAAMAHVLALKSSVANEAIIIQSKVPFTRADSPALLRDAPAVILAYFPAAKALRDRGIQLPQTIDKCYDIGKAENLLGYRPAWTFERWLDHALAQWPQGEGCKL